MSGRRWQWLLRIEDGRQYDRLLHDMKLRPSKFDSNNYYRYYSMDEKPEMSRHIDSLRGLGLHGVAKKVPYARQSVRRKYTNVTVSKDKNKPAPRREDRLRAETPVIDFEIAKQNRLAADALKLAIERRKQAEKQAEREANRRARDALLRAKGEM